MTFFQGATDVKINGGEFTVVNGNYTVFDRSRHTSNVNSFNTTNNTTLGSYNDNSQRYYNQRGQRPPEVQRSSAAEAHYPAYFPPPSVHPALGSEYNPPPGSAINNHDSYNFTNDNVESSYNDNSLAYNVPFSERLRIRNPNVGPRANPQRRPYSLSGRTASSTGPHATSMMTAHSQSPPPYVRADTSSSSSASFAPGQVASMGPNMQQAMDTLMREVAKETSFTSIGNSHGKYDDYAEEGSDDSNDSEEEMQTYQHQPTDSVNVRHGLAHLSLEDPSTRPSFSQTKSAPQESTYDTSHTHPKNGITNDSIPQHSNSTPSLPQDNADGYIKDQEQARASWQSQPSQTYLANSAATAFGSATITSPNAPVFNTVNGAYTKYDNSHHISNIGSGNTSSTLIKDSFNDQSFQTVALPEPKSRFKGLGKKFRR